MLAPLIAKGLSSVLLFGVPSTLAKDSTGSGADSASNPVIRGCKVLRDTYPQLLIVCDVCLCEYTVHGHCGVLDGEGLIDNAASIARIAEVALAYAVAGAHVVAPSDMMDNRIAAIKAKLTQHNQRCTIMSYSTKFASSFYGPFRDAAKSAPQFGNRSCYQLPAGSAALGLQAAERDISEGADIIMVKPGMPYMDIVRSIKDKFPASTLAVYQVSGEYVMLHYYGTLPGNSLERVVTESVCGIKRAGGDVIITYFAPLILDWIEKNKGPLVPK